MLHRRRLDSTRRRVHLSGGHEAGEEESHFQRLFVIETGIELAPIGARQISFGQAAGTANAFGYRVAGEFKVNAAEMTAALPQDPE